MKVRPPSASMTMVAKRDLLARLPGRSVGLGLHAVDELLDADAEANIELAALFENDLAVIVGVKFFLAKLEDARFALAQRQQFQSRVSQRLGRGRFGKQIEALI